MKEHFVTNINILNLIIKQCIHMLHIFKNTPCVKNHYFRMKIT